MTTLAPFARHWSACVFCFWASPSAFVITYETPAFLNAATSAGRSCVSQRTDDFGSGSSTQMSAPPVRFVGFAIESLISRGASHRISFVVLSAVQMVPRMQGRAGAILEAQQARGLSMKGSFVGRMRKLVPLVTPVLLGSLVDVRERTFALEARGFGARPGRTAYRVVADPPIDRWLRLLILAGAVAVVLFAIGVIHL